MGLIDVIRNTWMSLLHTCSFPLTITDNDEDPHLKINDQYKKKSQIKSRELYHAFFRRGQN